MLIPDISFHSSLSQAASLSMSTVGPPTSKPGSTIEPLGEHGSAVRFETQCVVIPDHVYNSKRPRVVTRSYALPLWKRRTSSPGPSPSAPPGDTSFEENQSHLVLRVPLPTFSPKPNWKARSLDDSPLPPCLVHRPQASGPSCPSALSPTRHARTPPKPSPSPPRSDVVTIPLRPCCTACQPVTEAALADGDTWIEHFSRGASRRRSLSVDGGLRTITIAGSAASASYGDLGVSISVDEIDKRRRRSNAGSLATNPETLWSQGAETKEGCSTSSILRRIAASKSSVADTCFPPSLVRTMPATLRIPEEEDDETENENELFPLPSPKRTPTTSPPPSPTGSLSCLTVVRSSQRSTSCPTPSVGSGDSAGSTEQRFFTPPLGSSSSLSLPDLSGSPTLSEDPPHVPSPRLLSTLPSISGRRRSRSPSPHTPYVPPIPSDILPSATGSVASKTLRSDKPLPELPHIMTPSPGALQPSPQHSPVHIRLPWRSKRPASAGTISTTPLSPTSASVPPTSFALSSGNRVKPFSMPSTRHIVASVIRGVGAMGPGGMGVGVMPPGGISPGM